MASSGSQTNRVIPVQIQLFGIALNIMSAVHRSFTAKLAANMWFTVFKTELKPWVSEFWQSANKKFEVTVNQNRIPVYTWGSGPLIVVMHGWSGSGTQFRRFIPELVERGYRVAAFDAPGHGSNAGKQSDLIQFSDALLAIEHQFGEIDTILAHSLGSMATLYAIQQGMEVDRIVLLGPHLDVGEMFQTYSGLLKLNAKLSERFFNNIGQRMQDLLDGQDPWQRFTPQKLLENINNKGLLVFDEEDEEVSFEQFRQIENLWPKSRSIQTTGLGHSGILKDPKVIESVINFVTAK